MDDEKPKNRWKEISARWDGGEGYVAVTNLGASVLMGKDKDGKQGIGPMDMLLAGLAGCTMMDVVDILKKKRQPPDAFKAIVRGNQRIDEYPYQFTQFHIEYTLWSDNLLEKDVEQAIKLSEEKYCSVGGTLSKAGPIQSSFKILKPGEVE